MRYLTLVVLLVITSCLPASADRNRSGNVLKAAAGVVVLGLFARALEPKPAPAPQAPVVRYERLGTVAVAVLNGWSMDQQQLGNELAGQLANAGFSPVRQQDFDEKEVKRLEKKVLYVVQVSISQGNGRQASSGYSGGRFSSEGSCQEVWAHASIQVSQLGHVVFSLDTEATDKGGSSRTSSWNWGSGSEYSSDESPREDIATRKAVFQSAYLVATGVFQRFGQAQPGYSQAPQYRGPQNQPQPSYHGKVQSGPQGQPGPAEYDPTAPQFSARGNNQISR